MQYYRDQLTEISARVSPQHISAIWPQFVSNAHIAEVNVIGREILAISYCSAIISSGQVAPRPGIWPDHR